MQQSQRFDLAIRQDIMEFFDYEPRLEGAQIGVAVKDGVVTLTGYASSGAECDCAAMLARRVPGVVRVIQTMRVAPAQSLRFADEELRQRILSVLTWYFASAIEEPDVEMTAGWATLTGRVDHHHVKEDAEEIVRRLLGVTGVSNRIEVRARPRTHDVRSRIGAALERRARQTSEAMTVALDDDGALRLSGRVKDSGERTLAERAARAAPGVCDIRNRLHIE